jgi:hypothetical protein
MKKFLLISALTAITALMIVGFASCGNKSAEAKSLSYQDTVGLSQFQAWKMMNERVSIEETFGNKVAEPAPVVKRRATTSQPKSVVMNSSSTHEAKVAKKKGWSKAAKYAVIGGGSGAVLGAVINKKDRVKGGVVGGVVLGGLGYIIGRSQDRKDGRVTK